MSGRVGTPEEQAARIDDLATRWRLFEAEDGTVTLTSYGVLRGFARAVEEQAVEQERERLRSLIAQLVGDYAIGRVDLTIELLARKIVKALDR